MGINQPRDRLGDIYMVCRKPGIRSRHGIAGVYIFTKKHAVFKIISFQASHEIKKTRTESCRNLKGVVEW